MIGAVIDAPVKDSAQLPATRPDVDIPIVAEHKVGKDGRTDSLRTEDGRKFERQEDGSYQVTVPGSKPETKVTVHDLSIVNGNISYRIGNYMAIEGHGKRFVSNLVTGETVDHSRKADPPKQAAEQTNALKDRLLNGGTDSDRLKALRALIDLSHTTPSAARFLDEAASGAHDHNGKSLSKQVREETVRAESQRLAQAASGINGVEEHAALRSLVRLSTTFNDSDAKRALQDYGWPLGQRDEKRAAKVELAQMMEKPNPFDGAAPKCTAAMLDAAAKLLDDARSKGPLTYEQSLFAAGALRFAQESFKDSPRLADKFATILGTQLDGPGAVDGIRAVQNQLKNYPDEQNVLIKYALMKNTDNEQIKQALATSIVQSEMASPQAQHVLDQILAKDKSADTELLRKTRETEYLNHFPRQPEESYWRNPLEVLSAVKRLASIEDSSPQAKATLDSLAGKSDELKGVVQYARWNDSGGPDKVADEALKSSDTGLRIHVWRAAAKDLSAAADHSVPSEAQISLAATAKTELHRDALNWKSKDYFDKDFFRSTEYKDGQDKLENVLKKAIAGGKADAVADDCYELLHRPTQNSERDDIARLYVEAVKAGIGKDNFQRQFEDIAKLCQKNDQAAIAIMVSFASGTADQYDQKDKAPVAAQAAKLLSDMSRSDDPDRQRALKWGATMALEKSWADYRVVETVTKLSASVPGLDWIAGAYARAQANNNAAQPESPAFKSGIRALTALGERGKWEPDDTKALLTTFNPEVAEAVKKIFAHIDVGERIAIFHRLSEITANDALNPEIRRLAQDTYKSLDKFNSPERTAKVAAIEIPQAAPGQDRPTKAPVTAREIVAGFVPTDFSQVKQEDMERVKKLVDQLGAPTRLERDNAVQKLTEYGSAIIPLLSAIAKDPSLNGEAACQGAQKVIGAVLEKQVPVMIDSINAMLRPEPGKRVDIAKLEETIKAMDLLAGDPALRAQRKNYLDALSKAADHNPESYTRIQQGLDELRNIDQLRGQLRMRLATEKLAAGDKEGARRELTEALTVDPTLVRRYGSNGGAAQFSKVFVDANGTGDAALTGAYQKAGGNPSELVPRSTASLEAAAGAQPALKIRDVVEDGKHLFERYQNYAKPQFDPAERTKRIDQLIRSPDGADKEEVIALCLDQYKAARNDFERNQAIDGLKKAVQNGNDYALEALRKLSTMDASMRLADAVNTLNSPLASDEQKLAAQKKKEAAVMDLARHEYAERDRRSDEFVGDAKGVMDYLAKGAAPGVTAKDVETARSQVKVESQERATQFAQTVKSLSTASGASRAQALEKLERLALDQLGKEHVLDYINACKVMQESEAVRHVLTHLDDKSPRQAADGLLRISELEQSRHIAGLSTSFSQLGKDGEDLCEALRVGNRAEVERLLGKESLRAAIKEQLVPRVAFEARLAGLKPDDVLKVLEDPNKLNELLKVADKEAKANQKIVDDLVNDYLLRSGPGKPARDELTAALPAEDKVFRLPSNNEQLRSQLQKAVDLEQLPKAVAKHVNALLSGAELSAADVKELRAALNVSDEQRRRDAIAQLNKMSFDHLQTTYKFESVVKELEALEQLQGTNRSVNAAAKMFDPGSTASAQDKAKAAEEVAKDLEKLKYMSHDHVSSAQALYRFDYKDDQVISDLRSGDSAKIAAALKTVQEKLPDATAKLDEYRAARIVRVLGPKSKPADYERVSQQLDVELEAARKEDDHPNAAAADWQQWAKTSALVSKITEAADKGTPQQAKDALNEIINGAQANNPYARAALAAVLVGDQNNPQISYWLQNHTNVNGDRPIYVPNFRDFPPEIKADLLRKASDGLLSVAKSAKLTTEETSAAALTLAKVSSDQNGDKKTIENLTAILTGAVEGKDRKEALMGIYQAIESAVPNAKVLSAIYLRGINDPEFAKQFAKLKEFSKDVAAGTPNDRAQASYRILAGVSGGMADNNEDANPHRKILQNGKEIVEEVNPIAMQARKALEDAAQVPGTRGQVTEGILEIAEKGKTDARFKDSNQLMASLGNVAAELTDTDKEIRARAMVDLREAVKATAAAPDSAAHKSAVEGFFAMAKHWQNEDVELVKTTFTDVMLRGLQANADKILPAHREQIIGKMVENFSAAKEAVSFETRLNSVRALTALGKYLNAEQVAMLSSFGGDARYNVTSFNVNKVLEQNKIQGEPAKKIQEAIANHQDLNKVLADLKVPDKVQAEIKDAITKTKNGNQNLADLGITGDKATLFKATVAESLLSVLAQAPYNLQGKEGPRELAYNAFRDVPWPMFTGEVKDGKPEIITDQKDKTSKSWDSNRLRQALVDYYMGKPIASDADLDLVKQINRIVDNAKLPRPSALIVRDGGIEGTPIKEWKPGMPDTVLQITDKIIRNYTTNTETGQDALRRVMANLETINSLPGNIRADIMGWTKKDGLYTLTDKQKEALGWEAEPSPERKQALGWDKLSPEEQEAIRWQNAKIPARLVLAQMSTNELQDAPVTRNLLHVDIQAEVNKRVADKETAIFKEKGIIKEKQKEKNANLDEFVEKTSKGANFGNQLIGFFTFNNGIDAQLNERQTELARSFARLNKEIGEHQGTVGKLEQDKGGMRLAREVREYTETLNSGDQAKADKLAMKMWIEHGPMLAQLAPQVWHDLTQSTDTTLQGASMLKRLKDRELAHWDSVPGYTSGYIDPKYPYDRSSGLLGMREALGLNAAFSTPELKTVEKNLPASGHLDPAAANYKETREALKQAIDREMLSGKALQLAKDLYDGKQLSPDQVKSLRESLGHGLMQLQRDSKMLDTEALRVHMIGRVDQDPVLMKFSNQSRKMGEDLNELNKMFGAAMKGSVYDDTINVMKEKAQRIKDALNGDPDNPITTQDLYDLSVRIKTMQEAADKMKANPEHDPKALEDLQTRIDTFKGMHNLFNKFGEPLYPTKDEKGNVINQNQQINDMCKRILDGGLTAATFTSWVKENGVLIGVSIAACAATVAACATFGVASPAAVGLWVAVVGLAAREVTNEILYQVNKDGYTGWGSYDNKGSRIGDWNRKAYAGKFADEYEAAWSLLKDVAGPYAFEIARDWVAFVATAGIMNRIQMGSSSEAVKALFKAAPPRNAAQLAFQAERMSLAESGAGLDKVATSYLRQFMGEFAREVVNNTAITGVQTTLETGIHAGIGRENMNNMGEHWQFLMGFGLSTALAMGQGGLHSTIFRQGTFEPGSTFKFKLAEHVTEAQMVKYMRQQGLEVTQIAPGKWEILPVGAGPHIPPITMIDTERGVARPPADLAPDGHVPQKESRPVAEDAIKYDGGHEWKQTPEGKQLLKQLGDFTEQFMKPNGDGVGSALKIAIDPKDLPSGLTMRGVDPGEHLDMKAFAAAKPHEQAKMLQDFMEKISGVGKVDSSGKVAQYPEVIVKFDGHEFNLATGKPIGPNAPSADAQTAFDAFRGSAVGKRLVAEQALHAMEEKLHLLHQNMGNAAFSPSFVKFMKDTGTISPDQVSGAKRSDGSETARASLEKEVILALYDQGWSREMLEHHFGRHHSDARAEVLNWLKGQEALADRAVTGKLKAMQGLGVDRALMEDGIRTGRIVPEDVETIHKLVRDKVLTGDEVNKYMATPEAQKAFSEAVGNIRSLQETLGSIDSQSRLGGSKAIETMTKLGETLNDIIPGGDKLVDQVGSLRDALVAGTATPDQIQAVAKKLTEMSATLKQPENAKKLAEAFKSFKEENAYLTKQAAERNIDASKLNDARDVRTAEKQKLEDAIQLGRRELKIGDSDIADLEVLHRSNLKELRTTTDAKRREELTTENSKIQDLLKLEQQHAKLTGDLLLIDALQAMKPIQKQFEHMMSFQKQDVPPVWQKAAADGNLSVADRDALLNGTTDKKNPPIQMVKGLLDNDRLFTSDFSKLKKAIADVSETQQARTRQLNGRMVEIEIARAMATSAPNNTYSLKVDTAEPRNTTKTWTYDGKSIEVPIVPDHPDTPFQWHDKSKTIPARYQVDPSTGEFTSKGYEVKDPIVIKSVGSDGKPIEIKIPKGSKARISGPDDLTPGEPVNDTARAGLIFMEPKPDRTYTNPDGTKVNVVKEYRVMPKTDLPEHHATYDNGYTKQMEVHVDATTGKVMQRVYLGADGKPVTVPGIDGKPVEMNGTRFGFEPEDLAQAPKSLRIVYEGKLYNKAEDIPKFKADPVTHADDIKKMNAELRHMKRQVRTYHAYTHFHVQPTGWTARP